MFFLSSNTDSTTSTLQNQEQMKKCFTLASKNKDVIVFSSIP